MRIFVDTGAWYSLFAQRDVNHHNAQEWLKHNRSLLLTTDYILDELLTLLMVRENTQLAIKAGKTIWTHPKLQIEHVTSADVEQAWQVFQKYQDKGWSFTDCTSNVIIDRLNITHAFAFDKHFEQFGLVVRVP